MGTSCNMCMTYRNLIFCKLYRLTGWPAWYNGIRFHYGHHELYPITLLFAAQAQSWSLPSMTSRNLTWWSSASITIRLLLHMYPIHYGNYRSDLLQLKVILVQVVWPACACRPTHRFLNKGACLNVEWTVSGMSIMIFSSLFFIDCWSHCGMSYTSFQFCVLISTDYVTPGGPTLVLAFFWKGGAFWVAIFLLRYVDYIFSVQCALVVDVVRIKMANTIFCFFISLSWSLCQCLHDVLCLNPRGPSPTRQQHNTICAVGACVLCGCWLCGTHVAASNINSSSKYMLFLYRPRSLSNAHSEIRPRWLVASFTQKRERQNEGEVSSFPSSSHCC